MMTMTFRRPSMLKIHAARASLRDAVRHTQERLDYKVMNMKQIIENICIEALSPDFCQVEDESYLHHVPPGTESHFKLVICSKQFEGLGRVPRHQKIYALLSDYMPTPIHALAIHAYAPNEWTPELKIRHSPACLGGN